MKDNIFEEALMLLSPNSQWSIKGEVKYENLTWTDEKGKPSEVDVNTKIEELQAEYDAQEYARKRQAEYPTIAELTVALYDTDDKADIEAKRAAVKLKYPKP